MARKTRTPPSRRGAPVARRFDGIARAIVRTVADAKRVDNSVLNALSDAVAWRAIDHQRIGLRHGAFFPAKVWDGSSRSRFQ